MKVNVWFTGEDDLIRFNLATTEEERMECLHVDTRVDLDMSLSGWLLAGTAELSNVELASRADLLTAATATIDAKEQQLRTKHQRQLNELDDLRGRLLALPTPAKEN